MHKPMPAYRASRNLGYVEIEGRQVPLGKHPDGLPEPKKAKTKGGARGEWNPPDEIKRAYSRVMGEGGREDLVPAAVASTAPPMAEVPAAHFWSKTASISCRCMAGSPLPPRLVTLSGSHASQAAGYFTTGRAPEGPA